MSNNNFVISIADTMTIHYDTETRLVSTLSAYSFNRSSRFKTREEAEKYAQSLINGLKNNPAITKQELQYVSTKTWSVIDFTKNLCANCQLQRVAVNKNRCLSCSYM